MYACATRRSGAFRSSRSRATYLHACLGWRTELWDVLQCYLPLDGCSGHSSDFLGSFMLPSDIEKSKSTVNTREEEETH